MKLTKLFTILIFSLSIYSSNSQCMHQQPKVPLIFDNLNTVTSKDILYLAITNAALADNMPQFSLFFDDSIASHLHLQNPNIAATAKENANLTHSNGKSILMGIAHIGKKEFVAKLLKAGANHQYSINGHSAFIMGLISGSHETAGIIIDAGATTNSALTKIVALGNKTGVETFLKLKQKIKDYKKQIAKALILLNTLIKMPVQSTSTAQNAKESADLFKLIEMQSLLMNFEKQEKEAKEKLHQKEIEIIQKRKEQANKEKKARKIKQKKALIAAAQEADKALKENEKALADSLAAQREEAKKKFEEEVEAMNQRDTQANIDDRLKRDQKQAEREARREKEADEERLKSALNAAVAQVKKEVKAQKNTASATAASEKPKNKPKKRNKKKSNYTITNFEAQLIAQRKAVEERDKIEQQLKAAKNATSNNTK